MATNNKPRGLPFAHGNPGRPPGSKNKATLLAASLSDEQGEALVHKAYEMAMDGNVAMLKCQIALNSDPPFASKNDPL